MGRLKPLDGQEPVDMWTTPARCPQAHRPSNKKQRSIDVLPKPDNLICYQQYSETAPIGGSRPLSFPEIASGLARPLPTSETIAASI